MTEQTTDRADAITDAALDALAGRKLVRGRMVPRAARFYTECPGCEGLVHHTDETVHARECEKLRALAAEEVDG